MDNKEKLFKIYGWVNEVIARGTDKQKEEILPILNKQITILGLAIFRGL